MKTGNDKRDTPPVDIRKKTGELFCYGKTQTDPDFIVLYGYTERDSSFFSNSDDLVFKPRKQNSDLMTRCCEVGCRILKV